MLDGEVNLMVIVEVTAAFFDVALFERVGQIDGGV